MKKTLTVSQSESFSGRGTRTCLHLRLQPQAQIKVLPAWKPASNTPPECCDLIIQALCPKCRKHRPRKWSVLSGGGEGNRTPVRKQLGRNFSGRSLLFTFPHPDGNKHPYGISSVIMHGALNALRTHGLHSNHTQARLVDLPGRMRA